MKYGCIGEKLGHSFSAVIHEKIGLYEYELCPVAREDLHRFLTERDFLGINVTIPYKKDVIPYLAEISPAAQLCGAVNTVVNRNGLLYGDNTDFYGMKALMEHAGIDPRGKDVLILGSGGTSGTALCLCQSLGAKCVNRVSRGGGEGFLTYEEASRRDSVQILINTTPCGMYPNMGESAISIDFFPHLEGIVDAVYNPLNTELVLQGQAKSIPSVGGLFMLVAQAVCAAGIFTGREDLLSLTEPIYQELLREKQNVVLTGMPGSGKSTLGRALAARLGKEFADSDDKIALDAGMSIPEIFAREGEAAFRDRESEAIASLAARQGMVIATGGGAILREENVRALRANGTILFLDAPLESLIPTSDRPLSSDEASLRRRYEERYGLYLATSHKRVPVSRNIEENLALMEKELS